MVEKSGVKKSWEKKIKKVEEKVGVKNDKKWCKKKKRVKKSWDKKNQKVEKKVG